MRALCYFLVFVVVVFVFNIPPTAKVISDRLVKPGIEPATPGFLLLLCST